MCEWNRREPRNRSMQYAQLISDRDTKASQWRKDRLAVNGATGHPEAKK